MAVNAVQLRLGFALPSAPVTLRLIAVGMRVDVECSGSTSNDAHAYLAAAGCTPDTFTTGSVSFPLHKFTEVTNLPERVTLFADETLHPLLEWVENPSDDDLAAELEVSVDGSLWMRWTSQGSPRCEPLSPASAAALLTANVPFVASDGAFEVLRMTCPVPLLVGRCTANRDGYILIETSKPQLVEASGLTGLFRLDETHYGLPLPGIKSMEGKPGFVWDGPLPRLESGPRFLPPMSARLSRHVAADLRPLVDALAAYRTQVVSWDAGLGRRVFVLAALEALDAFPTLVVCRADRVWQWWRHAALFGKTASVSGRGDIQVLTYAEFAKNPRASYNAQALVFDDVTSAHAAAPEVAAAAVGVGGMLDCYLVGITDALPQDPRQLVNVMARLRPAEFSPIVPLVERYGTDLRGRLREHAESYVSRRSAADPGRDQSLAMFNHTQVQTVEMSRTLRKEYADLAERISDPGELLAARIELCSSGSRFSMSPKVSAAMDIATQSLDAGRRVALVTETANATSLLSALLATYQPQLVQPRSGRVEPSSRLAIICGSGALPDLSWFDEVVILDYPVSYADLDAALGDPAGADSPSRVACLHILDTADDDRAVLAAWNAEHGTRVSVADYLACER